jgi:hypothetical protein
MLYVFFDGCRNIYKRFFDNNNDGFAYNNLCASSDVDAVHAHSGLSGDKGAQQFAQAYAQ